MVVDHEKNRGVLSWLNVSLIVVDVSAVADHKRNCKKIVGRWLLESD